MTYVWWLVYIDIAIMATQWPQRLVGVCYLGLIPFWSYIAVFLRYVEQLSTIIRQTVQGIELKRGRWIQYGIRHAWWTFSYTQCFSLLFVEQFLCIYRQPARWIDIKLGGLNVVPQSLTKVWLCYTDLLTVPGLWLVDRFPRYFV